MVNEAQPTQKKRRERSPSYPGIHLETAIEKMETLFKIEGKHFAPTSAIMEHWGYKEKSSFGMVSLAALLKYGLLEDQGSGLDREAKITDLGLSIVLPEDEQERKEAIKHAALMPGIHKELWEQYEGRMPSDASLRVFLIRQKNFNPSAVDDFIGVFKHTIAVAELTESDKMAGGDEDTPTKEEDKRQWPDLFSTLPTFFGGPSKKVEPETEQPTRQETEPRIIQLPLLEGRWAAFQADFPMSEDDWIQMLAVLGVMKAGLVEGRVKIATETGSHDAVLKRSVLSAGAHELLDTVDDGGVPLYVTDHLKRIAGENGIEVSDQDTPNSIVEALRALDE